MPKINLQTANTSLVDDDEFIPSIDAVLMLLSDEDNGWESGQYTHPKHIRDEFIELYRRNPLGWDIHWQAMQYVPFDWNDEKAKWVASVEAKDYLVDYIHYIIQNPKFVEDCNACMGM